MTSSKINFYKGRVVKPVMLGVSVTVLLPLIFVFRHNDLSIYYPILIWFIYVFRYNGVIIDFDNKSVKSYTTILFFKVGNWRSIEEFPYYMIKLMIRGSFLSSKVGEMSSESRVSSLVLYDKLNKKELLIKKGDKEELIDVGTLLKSIGVERKQNRFKRYKSSI